MIWPVDATHDPALRSSIEAANAPDADFPIQNLPFGVFRRDAGGAPRIGVAIGDRILDLCAAADAGLLAPEFVEPCRSATLNRLMGLGRSAASALRRRSSEILRRESPESGEIGELLVAMSDAEMLLPAEIGDYTDFYASIDHATNVGSMFRPDNPLLPNYKWVPIAYHGRSSSIVVSGAAVERPQGQVFDQAAGRPEYRASRMLDYELEVGLFVGSGNARGSAIPIGAAEEHLFGACLVNDWSARDMQSWEYQPLGPFLAKNFATTISPWVVTMDALAPYRAPAAERVEGDPQPLAHLDSAANRAGGGIAIRLEVWLRTARMKAEGRAPQRLSRGDFARMYWTPAQMVAHHASNGCNLRPGDLLASGTVSGPSESERGCLLELTWRGSRPIALLSGEQRRFLEDGDEVIFRGYSEREGYARIGFGECRGTVTGAP
jgi:fumarylacetoacetase